MIKALAHVCLYSRDLDKTEAFYRDALNLPVQFRFIRNGALHGFYLRAAESQFIEVFHRADASSGVAQIGHLCLEVDDIQALRKHFDEIDLKHTEPKLGADNSWQMWITDPDGTSIELHQYTAKSTQFTGEDCIVTW
jgi:lactoylglutathione lyase/glyoxylase I family protein